LDSSSSSTAAVTAEDEDARAERPVSCISGGPVREKDRTGGTVVVEIELLREWEWPNR
jgi:hypothetical protein